uniref:Uncharacterized protein n=1 Tax=Mimivirus LCMiAC02 TaxID=2506609 RepID=A0A4D5XFE1_9VIRU|nr:MAG: hypothetical protein LCMiAC02_03470 [Mimivirus LCMiAC02]
MGSLNNKDYSHIDFLTDEEITKETTIYNIDEHILPNKTVNYFTGPICTPWSGRGASRHTLWKGMPQSLRDLRHSASGRGASRHTIDPIVPRSTHLNSNCTSCKNKQNSQFTMDNFLKLVVQCICECRNSYNKSLLLNPYFYSFYDYNLYKNSYFERRRRRRRRRKRKLQYKTIIMYSYFYPSYYDTYKESSFKRRKRWKRRRQGMLVLCSLNILGIIICSNYETETNIRQSINYF